MAVVKGLVFVVLGVVMKLSSILEPEVSLIISFC